jgi:hypothetical protein
MVNITKAYLILEVSLIDNSKDFSPSRFEDKEVSGKLVCGNLMQVA